MSAEVFIPLGKGEVAPETVQTCLKFDLTLFEKLYRSKGHPQSEYQSRHPQELPDEYSFKLPEDWADKKELDEDGYARKKL